MIAIGEELFNNSFIFVSTILKKRMKLLVDGIRIAGDALKRTQATPRFRWWEEVCCSS